MGFHQIASDITLIHRRKEFKGVQDSVNKVMSLVDQGEVNFNMGTVKQKMTMVKAKWILPDDNTVIDGVDAIFPFFGLKIELGPIAEWGLNLENNLISVNTENLNIDSSNFAVGDICTYPGKLKLILADFMKRHSLQRKFQYCHNDKNTYFVIRLPQRPSGKIRLNKLVF